MPQTPGLAEPHRLTPQMAMRIAILGAFALALFAALFFRLWALQILAGDKYRNAALDNQVRTRRIAAPRGPVLDSKGRPLVINVASSAIVIWPAMETTGDTDADIATLRARYATVRGRRARPVTSTNLSS